MNAQEICKYPSKPPGDQPPLLTGCANTLLRR